jgi:hypothetical protein
MDGDRFGGLLADLGGQQRSQDRKDHRVRPVPQPGGPRRGGPSTKVVIATLAVTALVGALAGGVWGILRPAPSTLTTAPSTTAAPSATTSATQPAPSARPSTATPSATPTTPRDTAFVQDPWTARGMDFGLLTGITKSGGTVTLRVDRAQFLVGAAAKAYYAKHPDQEPQDYAIVNTNKRLRAFEVTSDAAVYAQFLLGDGANLRTERLSPADLYVRAKAATVREGTVPLWLRHSGGPDGAVWYVAEQFLP